MTATRKTKLFVWVTALALIMACAPSLATPSVPTLDPGRSNIHRPNGQRRLHTDGRVDTPPSPPQPYAHAHRVSPETPSPPQPSR